jgi:hypothetical protein
VSALARLQRDFLAEVLGEGVPARAGLATYRRNRLANLHGALASAYPVGRRLVGETFFREAAKRFARAHPSTSGDLNLYGADFAAFLADYPFARELPYLCDVARLEWACHESFHAGEATALDTVALAAVAQERRGEIRFRLHPAVRLIASAHPVMSIWEANQPERDGTPEASTGAEHVIVRREEFTVHVGRVAPPEWLFVAALARGETLEAAVDAVGADAASDFLAPLLARLAAGGVLCGFSAPEGPA